MKRHITISSEVTPAHVVFECAYGYRRKVVFGTGETEILSEGDDDALHQGAAMPSGLTMEVQGDAGP